MKLELSQNKCGIIIKLREYNDYKPDLLYFKKFGKKLIELKLIYQMEMIISNFSFQKLKLNYIKLIKIFLFILLMIKYMLLKKR